MDRIMEQGYKYINVSANKLCTLEERHSTTYIQHEADMWIASVWIQNISWLYVTWLSLQNAHAFCTAEEYYHVPRTQTFMIYQSFHNLSFWHGAFV